MTSVPQTTSERWTQDQPAAKAATSGPQRRIAANRVFDGRVVRGPTTVTVAGTRILAVEAGIGAHDVRLEPDEILSPGFIDLQINGGGDRLLNDDPSLETIRAIATAHRVPGGTTRLLPTLITDARKKTEALLSIAKSALKIAGIVGFHLEGPHISRARKGIHPEHFIRPMEPEDLALLCAFGRIGRSMVTVAPEVVTAAQIRELKASGLTVSIGHSNGTKADVLQAMDAGASTVTHLFNAMSQIGPRDIGVLGAALSTDSQLSAGIICDGLTVAPDNVNMAWRLLGPERLYLVSDAMPTLGGSQTSFNLLGREVRLVDGKLVGDDGTLGGTHIDMMGSVSVAVHQCAIPLRDALAMATATPGRAIGLGPNVWRIRRGASPDLIAISGTLSRARPV